MSYGVADTYPPQPWSGESKGVRTASCRCRRPTDSQRVLACWSAQRISSASLACVLFKFSSYGADSVISSFSYPPTSRSSRTSCFFTFSGPPVSQGLFGPLKFLVVSPIPILALFLGLPISAHAQDSSKIHAHAARSCRHILITLL